MIDLVSAERKNGSTFFMKNIYMKFQNPSIHLSEVSNFTKNWKNQSKFQILVILSQNFVCIMDLCLSVHFTTLLALPLCLARCLSFQLKLSRMAGRLSLTNEKDHHYFLNRFVCVGELFDG